MKLRAKISLTIAAICLVASVAPKGSVLNEIAADHIWNGDEIGVIGVAAIIWFAFHILLIFRETTIYAKYRRFILLAVVFLPVLLGGSAFLFNKYEAAKREAERQVYLAELERTKADRERKEAECRQLGESAKSTEFCVSYFKRKNENELQFKLSEFKSGKNLSEAWKNFLLQNNKESRWAKVIRSPEHGDYICLAISEKPYLVKDKMSSAEIALLDQVADKFVDYLNQNKILATQNRPTSFDLLLQPDGRNIQTGSLAVKWDYADLKDMKFNSSSFCGRNSEIRFLFRFNRYDRVIP